MTLAAIETPSAHNISFSLRYTIEAIIKGSTYVHTPSVELSSIRTTYPNAIDTAIVNSHTLVFFLKI